MLLWLEFSDAHNSLQQSSINDRGDSRFNRPLAVKSSGIGCSEAMDAVRDVVVGVVLMNDGNDPDLPLPNKSTISPLTSPVYFVSKTIGTFTGKFSGPWLETQLTMACAIGLFSFLVFSYCRTRMPVLFAPRTKLKGD